MAKRLGQGPGLSDWRRPPGVEARPSHGPTVPVPPSPERGGIHRGPQAVPSPKSLRLGARGHPQCQGRRTAPCVRGTLPARAPFGLGVSGHPACPLSEPARRSHAHVIRARRGAVQGRSFTHIPARRAGQWCSRRCEQRPDDRHSLSVQELKKAKRDESIYAVSTHWPPTLLIFFSAVLEKNLALTITGILGQIPLPSSLK